MTNTDMSKEREALRTISEWPITKTGQFDAMDAVNMAAVARQALESMPTTGFSAEDMATASAQGFRDGVASLSANAGEPTPPVAPPMVGEIALIEKALESVGITSLLNHGAASCVFTEGCCGVSQDHILAYTRKIALHCAVALAAPPTAQAEGWISVDERLPEPNVEVLCAGQGWGDPYVTACYYDDERREWYPINEHYSDATACAQYPTHWIPLPPPPTSAEGVEHG